ncbi:hypothetical protein QE177_04315 [Arsenophonus sp. aPb]|uniref:hypothetical protein n=1 Tax=Arsenophonus sp. aPb TaxID=3041619 RepID=UPI00246936D2|nr:hypothetical protein [Arsenophonus sp. aPb]WGL99668.1 hypothetical protein QE177_04315 [Arsenophonus sp. aPb]
MTDEELVNAAIALANDFYRLHGYVARKNFKYWESSHPQEQLIFEMVCLAFEKIRGSDVMGAIENIEAEND